MGALGAPVMPPPRLTYFDMRGRAEAIRLVLYLTGTAFEERRITAAEDWASLAPHTPFGLLPLYETDTLELCQSHAILRHLGRENGWLGQDSATDAALDMTQEALAEIQEEVWRFAWVDGWRGRRAAFVAQTLAPALARLAAWLARSGPQAPWFVGNRPTHVDLLAFAVLDEVDAFFPSCLAGEPALAGLHARVVARPPVAAYVASGIRPAVFGIGADGAKLDPRLPERDRAFENPWDIPIAPG
jgi:glutathione S-transferase